MNQKITLSLLGLTMAVVATLAVAPIVGEMAYAARGGNGGNANGGNGGVNGIECTHPAAAIHNPHCNGGTPGGAIAIIHDPHSG